MIDMTLAQPGEKPCRQKIQKWHKCQCDRKKGHKGVHACRAGFWRKETKKEPKP